MGGTFQRKGRFRLSDGKVVFDIEGNLSGINSALNSATNNISKQTAKWTVLGQTAMNALTSGAKVAFNAVKDFAKNAFEYNAQMQTYEVNFKTMLGSAEAAQAKMAELKQYAAKTPFAFGDLADATQTMLSFGLTSEKSALALRHLGDISLGDANKLKSLTLAFSQISSTGKLAGQDLLQMINAGFNPLKIIAEETGAAYADLKAVMSGEKTSEDFQLRMEAARREVEELGVNASQSAIMLAQIGKDGMISADMVAAAMRIATSEGGAFYKALENASTTAKGQISTIKDSWDMLAGKVTGGVFDQLSTNVLPKVITWLDELNAAYDKDGFKGLKGAAGGIFDELGTLAFNAGAGLLTQLYNGITGDTKTTEEVKAYLSEIFGAAGDVVDNIKGAGVDFLEWIRDNGDLVGAAAKTIGIGLGIFAVASNPLAGILTALAAALLLFTTDWATFEEKYPNIVKAFEDITGVDFSTFATIVETAKTKLAAFYNDALLPLFTWLSEHGEAVQLALAGIGVALMLMGAPVAGLSLLLGVVIANWEDITTAVDNAVSAIGTFFTQTIPDSWNQLVTNVKQGWQDNVLTPIDEAARAVADFLGIKVPEDWSMTKAIEEAWDELVKKINAAIAAVENFLGIDLPGGKDSSASNPVWVGEDGAYGPSMITDTTEDSERIAFSREDAETLVQKVRSARKGREEEEWFSQTNGVNQFIYSLGKGISDPKSSLLKPSSTKEAILDKVSSIYDGRFSAWGAEAQEAARLYTQYNNEYERGNKERFSAMEDCLRKIAKDPNASTDDFLSSFKQLASQFEEGMVELPVSWFEGAEASLQSELDAMHFSTTVNATVVPRLSQIDRLNLALPAGWGGQDHASGGIFNTATRFLGADGMHTFGESGTEALMPLDTLWRKMGLIFDQTFAANLDGLQYSILPQIPPAAASPGHDEDKLSETIAAAVREAVSGLTVEMDKRKVGRILKPVISQEMADDVNNRRWTS